MRNTRVTSYKVVLSGGFGLAGAAVGALLGKSVAHGLKGTQAWELPSIVIGSIAFAVIGTLLWASVSDRRVRVDRKEGD